MNVTGVLYLVLVGLIWGCTNPFMKIASKGKTKEQNSMLQVFSNVQYLAALAINLSGSLLYFLILRHYDLCLCVPVANSAAFLFTIATSWILGERKLNKRIVAGLSCVVCGLAFLIFDSIKRQTSVN